MRHLRTFAREFYGESVLCCLLWENFKKMLLLFLYIIITQIVTFLHHIFWTDKIDLRVAAIAFFLPATSSKKRLRHKYFPVNFAKFLRTPNLQNTSGWLLLKLRDSMKTTTKHETDNASFVSVWRNAKLKVYRYNGYFHY